jgi:hypothetical protein
MITLQSRHHGPDPACREVEAAQKRCELLSLTALGDRKAFTELYGATRAKLFASRCV